jgi:glycosyltransferase involved in cell wall biosynthesis
MTELAVTAEALAVETVSPIAATATVTPMAPTETVIPISNPSLSVIIPVFNEEESIPDLHTRVHDALECLALNYEIVYVDDGSRDLSFKRLSEIASGDARVRIVRFRRNFGQTAALQAGIEYSRGDILVFMDADLQNDPRDIGKLLDKINDGYDVVSGWRKDRHDALISRKIPSHLANHLISWVTGVHLNDYGCTLKAYRRDVLEHVKLYGDLHRFIPAIASLAGASVTEVVVQHHARRFGKSKYGIARTLRVLLDLITVKFLGRYSTKPLYIFGLIGFSLWLAAFLCGAAVIAEKILPPHVYAHRNPLLLLAVFLATLGIQFVMMGLLAELAVRTYYESQDKPTYVVRQVVDGAASPAMRWAHGERRRRARSG